MKGVVSAAQCEAKKGKEGRKRSGFSYTTNWSQVKWYDWLNGGKRWQQEPVHTNSYAAGLRMTSIHSLFWSSSHLNSPSSPPLLEPFPSHDHPLPLISSFTQSSWDPLWSVDRLSVASVWGQTPLTSTILCMCIYLFRLQLLSCDLLTNTHIHCPLIVSVTQRHV